MGTAERGDMLSMRLVVGCVLLLSLVTLSSSNANNKATCSDQQNVAKTNTAQAVLDCGTRMCKDAEGNSQQEQACLCANCVTEDKAAREASCACGLGDANSAAACKIYERLYTTCSGGASVHATATVVVFAVLTTMMQTEW